MRGKRCGGLRLTLFSAALIIGLAPAAAENNSPALSSSQLQATIFVLDASSSMNAKIAGASKISSVRSAVEDAVGTHGSRLSFGLVAFGHRKASNCADIELLAKPGEFGAESKDKLLDKIKPKGQSPVAAALSDAAKFAEGQPKLDVVLIADGGDSCDADLCSTVVALKEKAQGLRVHVVGVSNKADDLKPLSCVAAATGGTFAAAANVGELKRGLAAALDAVAAPAPSFTASASVQPAPLPQPAEAVPAAPSAAAALPAGTATALPLDLDAQAQAQSLPPGTVATHTIEMKPAVSEEAEPGAAASPSGETAVLKSAPSVQRVQSVPIAPPQPPAGFAAPSPSTNAPAAEAAPMNPPTPPSNKAQGANSATKSAAAAPQQVQRPVPVTFKALVTEGGPRLEDGLTWRVFEAKPSAGKHKLLSTHREAMPTAALLPGEYLVNAAYGLSNLTKKIKVESGRSLEETFVLNTGGLKLAAVLQDGEPLPESVVKFDILSDEEDQFGNRHAILRNAKSGLVIRLNAGAYRIESLYGDANAVVRADVTVEPGKITEATIKQTGAKTTFKLVQSLGGEALADTKWTILTSAGDVVKENAGALPTHILAPGSYAVIADHGGLSYTRKFSIEAGQPKQVEVVVDDGPTSPEDLKALTDPPEPPPPPAGAGGIMAGDGQAPGTGTAFDGFSSTAPPDPTAPLINPGILLRGVR